MSTEYIEAFKIGGVWLLAILGLWWLLRQSTEERQRMTEQFLMMLTNTIQTNIQMQERFTAAIQESVTMLKLVADQHSKEHERMIDMLARLLPVAERHKLE